MSDAPRPRMRLRRLSKERLSRGLFVLPTLFTVGNLFCGYLSLWCSINGTFERAALLIILAAVLDMLDGRIARLTGTTSAFGVEFDSLADVISFGVAPAILVYSWGLAPLGRLGMTAGFMFIACAAMRLARFNIQSGGGDKRYFVGMPSPTAAAIPASTVFAYPFGLYDYRAALPALLVVLVPAVLMVSTIRFRSFKTIDLQSRRSYTVLIIIAAGIVAIATHPKSVLLALAYGYLASAFIEMAIARFRRRGEPPESVKSAPAAAVPDSPRDAAGRG